MAARRRKTLVLCHRCHVDIHAGSLQRASGRFDTGEPDDAKVSSPVRWGADGKGLEHRDLAGGLPYYSHSRSSFVPTCAKRYVTSHQQRQAGTARDVAVTWPAVGTD